MERRVLNSLSEYVGSHRLFRSRKFPDSVKEQNLMAHIKYGYGSTTAPFKCTI
jgi:hypothetical protein